jgi:threonylcarbamoyladenosine tRNA methylthiotransferase MtaB
MLSVFVQTLGCKLNQLESEAFADAFRQSGFAVHESADGDSPSVVIINTCTVTSKADQKARRVIRKALRDYPGSLVIVTGCYAQLSYAQIRELENDGDGGACGAGGGRLFVLKGSGKDALLDLPRFISQSAVNNREDIRRALQTLCGSSEQSAAGGERTAKRFQFNPERFSEHTRSFLKIQDGCDKHCTYCRIRLARGPSVSLDAEQVLSRLRVLEKTHAEAVLTGVNISQYRGASGVNSLGELLDYLLAGTEKIALRLSSLAPESIDEKFARIISNKRIRPHFHLSIQSGSEKILEKMGRAYNAQTVEKTAALLRRAKDDPFLACDIITGFPGETEAEFEKTREMCKKTGFAWIHVFPYSKRPGTPAFSFSQTVHESEVSARVRVLTDLANQGRADYARRWIGREVDVLIEKGSRSESFCRGVSDNYLKVLVQCENKTPPLPGEVLRCRLCASQEIDAQNEDCDVLGVRI